MIRRRAFRIALAALALCVLLPPAAVAKKAKQDSGKYANVPPREVYNLAMKQIEKKNYYKARVMLEQLARRINLDEDLLPEIQLALADAYYGKAGTLNVSEAMSRYANFLTFYPSHVRADYAQYRLALCHFQQVFAPDRDQRETRVSIEEFRKIEGLYPGSPYVDLAAERIQEGSDLLAEHEYKVGRFYHRRRVWLGAIDRFMTALDHYPRYGEKDKLYYYLGESLMATERQEEGEVYLQKLLETYPGSSYETKARLLLKTGFERQ